MKAYLALVIAVAMMATASSAAPAEPPRVRSRAMLGAGAILTVMGGFALLVATPFTISAATCTKCGQHDVSLWPMMVVGGVFAAVGVPLIIVGAQKVPVAKAPAPRPALLLGPSAAAVRVQF